MEYVGKRIRAERKKQGLTLALMAKKLQISSLTLQRIETGKSSPSVGLLSAIAQKMNRSIFSFLEEPKRPFVVLKRRDMRSISSSAMKIKFIGPRKMIDNNIVMIYGELKKGRKIDPHTNPGVEWAYYIEGQCELRIGQSTLSLKAGDAISYDARIEHSITSLEKLKFIGFYKEDEK